MCHDLNISKFSKTEKGCGLFLVAKKVIHIRMVNLQDLTSVKY